MTTTRDVGDISTDPGGKSGAIWTEDARDSIRALWDLNLGQLASVAGTNAITASAAVSTGLTSLGDGMMADLIPVNTNTGATTLNVQSLGIKAIVDNAAQALVAGDLVLGSLYHLIFIAASDHWRIIGSAGVSNVTVTGGLTLQRSAPARLALDQGPTTSLTSVASRAFAATQAGSRVIVEGSVSRITDSGSEDTTGLTIHLYVDAVSVESITDAASPGQHTVTPVAFSYSPGDTDSHTYEIRAISNVLATFIQSSCYIVCSEWSPNA